MSSCTGIIKSRKDSRRAPFFDEVAYNLVVEVFDGIPFNLLSDVFLLLRLQSQFNKNLLELFVDVVDAELFE